MKQGRTRCDGSDLGLCWRGKRRRKCAACTERTLRQRICSTKRLLPDAREGNIPGRSCVYRCKSAWSKTQRNYGFGFDARYDHANVLDIHVVIHWGSSIGRGEQVWHNVLKFPAQTLKMRLLRSFISGVDKQHACDLPYRQGRTKCRYVIDST